MISIASHLALPRITSFSRSDHANYFLIDEFLRNVTPALINQPFCSHIVPVGILV